MSAVVLEDFILTFGRKDLSDRAKNIIMRSVVVMFAALFLGLAFAVEKMGSILQVMRLKILLNPLLMLTFSNRHSART